MTTSIEAPKAPETTTCLHWSVATYSDGNQVVMWACGDCSLRFYPACHECVDVGHRNIVHPHPTPEPEEVRDELAV